MIGTGILGYGSDCWDLSFHVLPGGGGHPGSAEAPLEGVPVEYWPRRKSEFEEDFLRVGTQIQLSHPELPLDKVVELATKTVSLENKISQEVQDLLLHKNYPLPTIGAIKEILCQKDGKDLSPRTLQGILRELKFLGVHCNSVARLGGQRALGCGGAFIAQLPNLMQHRFEPQGTVAWGGV
ncbi:hypothetical protein MRB53_022956 [Persea americana]|uniref:Uncharacterized protein n=1 Tax=Persea americana TaxID=3435 RepID=A0ACC2L8L2_PERAE|nr:hypothetical protein MRB53_022956 [Persea americana]